MSYEASEVLVVVMGVAGSGKTTLGRALAGKYGVSFVDADDFHSAAAVAQMRRCTPLSDQERAPWISRIVAHVNAERHACRVLACSALTRALRERLRVECRAEIVLVYLRIRAEMAHARLASRRGHFASAGLLASQLETLEEPGFEERAIEVDADEPSELLYEHIAAQLQSRAPQLRLTASA